MKTITDYLNSLSSGELQATRLVEQVLQRIEATRDYNCIISVAKERALQRAAAIDEARKTNKPLGRLAGIPFIAKDNFLTFGSKTTAASKMLETFEAPYQATAIERLEAEGAIMIAKANLDAFAHGGSTENSYFGPTKNPLDPSRVPGGSSGGSAAAVALAIVPFALGTDTGGSIRQPASFCGVVGLKPTYGLVSRYGVVAMASSTDTIGAIAHTADDVALVMSIIAGKDECDSTTLPERKPNLTITVATTQQLKIGIIQEYLGEATADDVKVRVRARGDDLKRLGHEVEEVTLPALDLSLAIYYVIVPAEISSNLSRYDGIKYGFRANEAKSLDEMYGLTRDQGFMAENKRRILIGNYVLSSGYYDAYYRKAQTARTILINEFAKMFEKYDVLIGPVVPTTAFGLGEHTDDPLRMYMTDLMTVAPSLAGLPAMSVPSGVGANNLPIGLQLIGPPKGEARLLTLAKQLEEFGNG